MPRLQAKSFATPDDESRCPSCTSRPSRSTTRRSATAGSSPAGAGRRPWARCSGRTSCPMRHLGYTISGSLRVVMDDGQALDIGPDEVFDIPPGHDKWVLGDEPWVTIEWGGSGRAIGRRCRSRRRADAGDGGVHRHRRLDRPAARARRRRVARPALGAQRAGSASSSTCSAAARSRRPATACWRSSTARPGRSGAPRRWSPRAARWAWRSGSACTPARWSWSATTSAGSPSTSRRGSSRSPAPGEVLARRPTTADLVEGSGIAPRGRRRRTS